STARRGLEAASPSEDRGAPALARQGAALPRRSACRRDRLGRADRGADPALAARRCRRGRRLHLGPSWARTMAQLSDDCFAFGGALLGVDAALALIEARIAPVVGDEAVPLSQAAGRILARDLVAQFDVPQHANSAVDGFALAHADLSPDLETVLPV